MPGTVLGARETVVGEVVIDPVSQILASHGGDREVCNSIASMRYAIIEENTRCYVCL